MAIPTENEFLEYIALAKDYNASEIRGDFASSVLLERFGPNYEAVTHFIQSAQQVMCRKESVISASPVTKWMNDQAAAKKAYKALWGGREPKWPTDAPETIAARLISRACVIRTEEYFTVYRSEESFMKHYPSAEAIKAELEDWNSLAKQLSRIRRGCEFWARWNCLQTSLGIATAFHAYFYTDRYKDLVNNARRHPELTSTLSQSIEFILTNLADGNNLDITLSSNVRRQLERIAEQLKTHQENGLEPVVPIRRLDSTARERVLAYDLWKCFRTSTGANKTKAIHLFLELKGESPDIDFRGLQRMVLEWRQAHAKTGRAGLLYSD